jgi:hypothetical protein
MPLPKRHVLSLFGTAAVAAMVSAFTISVNPVYPPPLVLSDALPLFRNGWQEADHRARFG